MMLYHPTFPGADGKRRKTKTWWLKFYLQRKPIRLNLRTRDRRAAEQKAHDMVHREELRAAGVIDPFEHHRKTVLSGHVADFDTSLKAAGVVERYRRARHEMLDKFVTFAEAKTLNDLDPAKANSWLASLTDSGLGARSRNIHYQALRQFGRWLARTRRWGYDPFESLQPLNEQADRRHVRRALTPGEVSRLLEAARTRPLEEARRERTRKGVTPPQEAILRSRGEVRRLIYLTAVLTGLRRGELGRARWCDVDLDSGRIRVPAASAKSRREQTVEVPGELREALLAVRPEEAKTVAPLFPRRAFPQTRTFWADLKAAGIEREDDEGRVVDFHSLRVTFVTWLVLGGVHPKTAQVLARHASIETTMQAYTDLRLLDVKGAVAALPNVTGAQPSARAEGDLKQQQIAVRRPEAAAAG